MDKIVINIVYAHYSQESILSMKRGKVSLIYSSRPIIDCDMYVYWDAFSFYGRQKGLNVFFLMEPTVVLPGQYNKDIWDQFDHVFTIYDTLIKKHSFTKYHVPRQGYHPWFGESADSVITEDLDERRKKYPLQGRENAICMINGNKRSSVPGELYSKRIEAALWFSLNSDIRFDAYGLLPFFLPNYRGQIENNKKLQKFSRYKYTLCFENTSHPVFALGYIDKILDSLEARTLPIYLGCPNIEEYIPKSCFIDFRDLKNYANLDRYLHSITESEYNQYIENIDNWVSTGGLRPYSWYPLYDNLVKYYAENKGIDCDLLFGNDLTWEVISTPQTVDFIKSSPLWTFDQLAGMPSPLINYRETFGGISLKPDKEHMQRATALAKKGNFAEAIKEMAWLQFTRNPDTYRFYAKLLHRLGHVEAEAIYLALASQMDPNHASATTDKTVNDEKPLKPQFKQPNAIKGMTSIIIITQNRLAQTKTCVKSIRKHTPEPHEIIFVDNGSTDKTVQWLKSQFNENKNYSLIENKDNTGLAKRRNQGINLSQGEFILLLDNCVVVSEGWLTGMTGCLNNAPSAGIISPMTNNADGLQQVMDDACRSVDFLDKYATKFKEQYCHRQIPCRNLSGFCMMFKRTVVEKIDLFDERFDNAHFEDEDFCWRSALHGYHNYIAGDVFVHYSGSKELLGDRSVMDKKWTLSLSTPEGKKLAVLKSMELADVLYQKDLIDQAVEVLINCIKLTPDAKEIYYELARFFIESKRYSEAWEVIGTMPETAKNELKGLECAAYTKEGLGLDEGAADYVDKMLSLDDKYAAALNLRGVLAYKKGEKEKATSYFQKAINANPGYGEAYANLGVLYWRMDKQGEALAQLKKGFILSPTVPDVSSLYYSVVSSLGLFSDAEDDYRDASRLHPHNKKLAFLSIDILIQQNKFARALIQIQDVLAWYGLDDGILNAALAVREKIGPLQIDRASRKGTLSLCMIVKNEEKYLLQCLKSVRDIVDEIIIVDTGSTDKTIDIAKIFGARLFNFPWTGDFSAARNHSLEQATGHWILVLDGDEVLSPLDFKELKEIIHRKSSTRAAYIIGTRNYIMNMGIIGWVKNDGKYPEEAGTGWIISKKVRLFTRSKDAFFSNPVHETLEHSLVKAKYPIYACNIVVHHYGKLDMQKDMQKGDDYYLLGKIKYENDPTNMKYILELARQAQVLQKNDEAIEMWLKLLSLFKASTGTSSHREIIQMSVGGDPLSEIYIQLAAAYLLLDRYEEALEAARKAMERPVKLKESVHVYVQCEIIAGSLTNAFIEVEALLKTMPDYPPALVLAAIIFFLEEKNEKAREYIQLLLQQRINITPLFNQYSRQLFTNGRIDEALVILNAAVENKLNDAQTTILLEELQRE